MDIQAYKPHHVEEAKRLFEKFYSQDKNGTLTFPDFLSGHLCSFAVLGDDGHIITAGGVRVIPEACLITDKDRPVRERVRALREVMRIAGFIARDFKFDWLHAVTDDPTWANQMKENGFVERGVDLEIHVGDIR